MPILKKGIDVSHHNGKLDWDALRPQIDYAIIRVGYGSDYIDQDDRYYHYNVSECRRLGIPFGVYLYSYATDTEKAKSEAQHVLRLTKNIPMSYPVYYDLEDEYTVGTLSNDRILDLTKTFTGILQENNYYVGIYASRYWFTSVLNAPEYDQWTKWIAEYNSRLNYNKEVGMWQYTSTGRLLGNSGDFDLNECYTDFPGIIVPAGLNNNPKPNAILKGDVDGDGRITVSDSRLALRAALEQETLTPEQFERADMDNDGRVTVGDARQILRIATELEPAPEGG